MFTYVLKIISSHILRPTLGLIQNLVAQLIGIPTISFPLVKKKYIYPKHKALIVSHFVLNKANVGQPN